MYYLPNVTCVTACPLDIYKRSQSYNSVGCMTNKCVLSSSKSLQQ
jgi:hypothetical protein